MIKESNIWVKCTEELSKVLTEKEMRTWIKPLGVKYSESGISLLAPNKFMKEEVERNFLDKIMSVVSQLHSNLDVDLSVESKVKA
jgi:chromosomal replication initiator protein